MGSFQSNAAFRGQFILTIRMCDLGYDLFFHAHRIGPAGRDPPRREKAAVLLRVSQKDANDCPCAVPKGVSGYPRDRCLRTSLSDEKLFDELCEQSNF